MKPTEYKTGDIAKALNVHENTVRQWSDRLSPLLSKRASSGKRKFTEDDFLVLATAADFRDKGLSFEAIEEALHNGQRIEQAPEVPTRDEIEARKDVQMVHIPRDTFLLDTELQNIQIQALQAEKERLETRVQELESTLDKTNDAHKQELNTLNTQIIDLTGKLNAAEREASIIQQERKPAAYWLQVIALITITIIIMAAVIVVYMGSRG